MRNIDPLYLDKYLVVREFHYADTIFLYAS